MRQPLGYLIITAATTLILLGVVVATNAAVDPFGMTRATTHAGWNQHKPATYRRVRLAKAYDVRHVAPRAIVLGTSRSHLGLRMTHPGWSASPRYNLGFDGAMTKEMFAYLEHAQSVSPLAQVVLGIDTWHLSRNPSGSRPGFDPGILLDGDRLMPKARVLANDLRVLSSLDTLRASHDTVRGQHSGEPEWLAPDGQRLGDLFFHRAGEMLHDQTPRAYFESYDREEIGWRIPPPEATSNATPDPGPAPDPTQSSLAWICRIVDFCRGHDIDLRIYITPMHAHQLEIAARTGEWRGVEAAKRALVDHLVEDARRHPGSAAIPLWDFTGYSSITTEALPAEGSTDEMRYYWDSSHFKEVVGDWVLDRLFDTAGSATPAPAYFGVRLTTAESIDAAIAANTTARSAYRHQRGDELARLDAVLTEILGPSEPSSDSPH